MDDIQLLAHILQGEAAVLGPAGMSTVAAVFVARMLSPTFTNTVRAVAPGFNGYAHPSTLAITIATDALADPAAFLAGHVKRYGGPYYYVMSTQDVNRRSLPPATFRVTRSATWALHLYQEDPFVIDHAHPPATIASPVPLVQ